MKTALYARLVFGGSAVLVGVVQLVWHDSEVWQLVHRIWTPFGTIVAWCLAIALIAGGIAMMFPRTARGASIVIGASYLLFSLASVPSMIVAPANPVLYVVFFEKFSVVCGAVAVYAATEKDAARSVVLGRAIRLALGVCTISFAWAQIVYLQYTASLVPKWLPPSGVFWTNLTTIAFALAGLATLINRQARLALRLMTLMLALFGVLVWVPRIIVHPETLSNWNEIAANYLIAGAAWMVAELKSF